MLALLPSSPWSLSVTALVKALDTNLTAGLSEEEAAERRKTFGPNALKNPDPTPFLVLVFRQFKDLLVLILLGAAVVSFLLALVEEEEKRLTAFIEPVVILLILVANAAVGVVQETNAEKAIQALKAYEASKAAVIRNSHLHEIHPIELVPGDVIVVATGQKVPADARVCLLQSSVLRVDQSLLTGESDAVTKDEAAVLLETCVDQSKTNMLFSGTLITRGRALAVVTAIGSETAMGRIQRDLDSEETKSPLKEKLDEFGEQLSKAIGVVCFLVWLINVHHFSDPERGGMLRGAIYYFKIAVALAVAAVPEGLPAVVTTCLALGAREMAKDNAIVRQLPAVETLGCTTVVCADKTGTMTTNQMAVQRVLVITAGMPSPAMLEFEVEGTDYTPKGRVSLVGGGGGGGSAATASASGKKDATLHPSLSDLARIASLCNEAKLDFDMRTRKFTFLGEPTEAALKVVVDKLGVSQSSTRPSSPVASGSAMVEETDVAAALAKGAPLDAILRVASRCSSHWERENPIERVLEFTRSRKSMSVVCKSKGGATRPLFCKGAPLSVLARCDRVRLDSGGTAPLDAATRSMIQLHVSRLGDCAYRCLAMAQGEVAVNADLNDYNQFETLESAMTFVGLVAMLDPPRPQVAPAIKRCVEAGIRVVMITGDDSHTAESVARSVGLLQQHDTDHVSLERTGLCISGETWAALDHEARVEASNKLAVMYRVEPQHKIALVQLLRELGEVVAMTGDGTNDAPALKSADIGISMGSGTAVAREASDMVLADDNFATIVAAVRQGRAIFANTKQFIRYLVSSNLGEVACIFLSAALGVPEALIPVQLLWVNLVTDGLPATALGFTAPDPEVMRRPPRSRSEPIVDRWNGLRFAVVGLYVGLAVVMGFVWWFVYFPGGPQMTLAELRSFDQCKPDAARSYSCDVFKRGPDGLDRASTVALSILVIIEMLNACNALSESASLLDLPPWSNRYLVMAISVSVLLHLTILYVPWFNAVFGVAPLGVDEWLAVVWLSVPVVLIDEVMKRLTRINFKAQGFGTWGPPWNAGANASNAAAVGKHV